MGIFVDNLYNEKMYCLLSDLISFFLEVWLRWRGFIFSRCKRKLFVMVFWDDKNSDNIWYVEKIIVFIKLWNSEINWNWVKNI